MSPKLFFAGLAITSIVQISISIFLFWLIPALRSHYLFIAMTISAMVLFSILLYGAAKIYARSALVRLFIQLILLAVFLKMLLCLALIIGYKKGFEPAENSFIWPFLLIYVSSTIYEVIFMDRVGREKPISKT